MTDAEEVPLTGGSVTEVVRVGDTVRRVTDRWSDAVHDLLLHLERVGFDAAPRYLGIDDKGREILSWLDGTPSTRPWPAPLLTLEGVRAVGRLLRRTHDALATYRPPADAEWVVGHRELGPDEIVLHNDLGPWNVLWHADEPVALIDWDFAAPGPPVRDLAVLAFFVTPMIDDEHCFRCGFDAVPDRRARLHALCEAYGEADVGLVLDSMEQFIEDDTALTVALGPQGVHPWAGFLDRGLVDENAGLLRWLRANRRSTS